MNMENPKNLYLRKLVSNYRVETGKTQKEIAEEIKVNPAFFSHIINGTKRCSFEKKKRIANYFSVHVTEVFDISRDEYDSLEDHIETGKEASNKALELEYPIVSDLTEKMRGGYNENKFEAESEIETIENEGVLDKKLVEVKTELKGHLSEEIQTQVQDLESQIVQNSEEIKSRFGNFLHLLDKYRIPFYLLVIGFFLVKNFVISENAPTIEQFPLLCRYDELPLEQADTEYILAVEEMEQVENLLDQRRYKYGFEKLESINSKVLARHNSHWYMRYLYLKGFILFRISEIQGEEKLYRQSLDFFQQSEKHMEKRKRYFEKDEMWKFFVNIWMIRINKAGVYQLLSDFRNQTENFEKSISIYKKYLSEHENKPQFHDNKNIKDQYYHVHIGLGIAYNRRNSTYLGKTVIDSKIAEGYFGEIRKILEKALSYFSATKTQEYADIQNELGNAYSWYSKYAQKENRKAILQKAVNAYLNSLEFYSLENYRYQYARTLGNLGETYSQLSIHEKPKENFNKAENYCGRAKSALEHTENTERYAEILFQCAVVYSNKKSHSRAIKFFEEALNIYKPESYYVQHGKVQARVSDEYFSFAQKETDMKKKQTYIEKSISHDEKIAEIFSKDNYPVIHGKAKLHLGLNFFIMISIRTDDLLRTSPELPDNARLVQLFLKLCNHEINYCQKANEMWVEGKTILGEDFSKLPMSSFDENFLSCKKNFIEMTPKGCVENKIIQFKEAEKRREEKRREDIISDHY